VQSSGPPSAAPSISEDASPATLSPATVSLLHTLQGFRVKECPTRKAKEGPAGAFACHCVVSLHIAASLLQDR
jgi:hypothetical protein